MEKNNLTYCSNELYTVLLHIRYNNDKISLL